jgi:PTH1 family peptidyl-tRNA hydrolase
MKVVFAQGNPGAQYATTRHNVGFMALDSFAAKNNATFSPKPKFQAEIAEFLYNNEKILLVKPSTFYNETGVAARHLIDFYKLNPTTDFLVIHDELALPFGVVRTRPSGSDAGNNGIKSLNAHLGQNYARIRIGIYNSLSSLGDSANFVLGHLTEEERLALPQLFTHVDHFIQSFLSNNFEVTKITSQFEEAT